MEFKDLKTAWDSYSSLEVDKHRLEKENIQELLKTRTKTLVDRIDRNIRIGMGILLAFITYVLIDDIFLSKILIQEPLEYPKWLYPIDVFSNTLIVTTYLFFIIRYLRIRRNFSIDNQLKKLLTGILDTLKTYRRMFYMAVIILLLNIMVSFTAGMYQGIKYSTEKYAGGLESLSTMKILSIIGFGLAIAVIITAINFIVLRWGFNKLYGQYLNKLNDNLRELDETGNQE